MDPTPHALHKSHPAEVGTKNPSDSTRPITGATLARHFDVVISLLAVSGRPRFPADLSRVTLCHFPNSLVGVNGAVPTVGYG